jgi:hypothetical protein
MSDDEFIRKMAKALKDPGIKELMHGPANVLIEKMDGRVKAVESKCTTNEQNIDTIIHELDEVREKLDDFEQRDRQANVIVTGLKGEITKANVAGTLKEKMKADIIGNDIKYVVKIGNDSDQTNRVLVVFENITAKPKVVTNKKKLKGQQLWINDDLTPHRSHLAYLARKAVKEKKIYQTWTTDGKVFIMSTEGSRPRKIVKPEDIPN